MYERLAPLNPGNESKTNFKSFYFNTFHFLACTFWIWLVLHQSITFHYLYYSIEPTLLISSLPHFIFTIIDLYLKYSGVTVLSYCYKIAVYKDGENIPLRFVPFIWFPSLLCSNNKKFLKQIIVINGARSGLYMVFVINSSHRVQYQDLRCQDFHCKELVPKPNSKGFDTVEVRGTHTKVDMQLKRHHANAKRYRL